jgi:hypothetical protein
LLTKAAIMLGGTGAVEPPNQHCLDGDEGAVGRWRHERVRTALCIAGVRSQSRRSLKVGPPAVLPTPMAEPGGMLPGDNGSRPTAAPTTKLTSTISIIRTFASL